jgi:Uma2 family endonuclease
MTTVQPVRIRTDEFDRMTDVGLFDGRRVELLEGTLYEMPPMRTPHLRAPLGRRKPTAADCQLVIEVSDTTLGFDRQRKLPAYLRGGVPTVWLVNGGFFWR